MLMNKMMNLQYVYWRIMFKRSQHVFRDPTKVALSCAAKFGWLPSVKDHHHYGWWSIHVICMIQLFRWAFATKSRVLETVNNRGQILVREQINFSTFSHLVSPNKEQHTHNVAHNPYAAAQFFHSIIKTTMETLFGVTSNSSTISCEMGVAGKLSAYIFWHCGVARKRDSPSPSSSVFVQIPFSSKNANSAITINIPWKGHVFLASDDSCRHPRPIM